MKFSCRELVWAVLSVLFSISLVLSAFTVHNYTEIARAKIFTGISTVSDISLEYDASGNLSSVNLTIRFTIENPSQKELKLWILSYKSWLRDRPMEDGAANSRWGVDGEMMVDGTEQMYYPVFSTTYSFDSPEVLLGPESNVTVTRYLELNASVDRDIMDVVLEIHDYTLDAGNELEWHHYTSAIIFIQDIPPYAGPGRDANLILRFEGYDLTPAQGGVGR